MIQVAKNVPSSGGSLLDIFTDNPIVILGLLFLAAVPVALNFFGGKVFTAGVLFGGRGSKIIKHR